MDEYLKDLSSLDTEDQLYLIRDIEIDELREYIKELESGKSPGSDGFSYEIYQKWGGLLCYHLQEAINCILKRERITVSMEEAFGSCWEKKGLRFGHCPKQPRTPPPILLDTSEVLLVVNFRNFQKILEIHYLPEKCLKSFGIGPDPPHMDNVRI